MPTLIVARTDANGAQLITSDVDPADQPVRLRRAYRRGLLSAQRRPRRGDRAWPRIRAVRRPHLVRDVGTEHRRSAPLRRRDPRAVPGQVARVQLFAVVQLEAKALGRATSRRSSNSWRRWAIKLPVHHARGLPRAQPLVLRTRQGLQDARHGRVFRTPTSGVRIRRRTATRRRAISAKSGPVTSTRSRRSSPRANRRRRHCTDRPKNNSSKGRTRTKRSSGKEGVVWTGSARDFSILPAFQCWRSPSFVREQPRNRVVHDPNPANRRRSVLRNTPRRSKMSCVGQYSDIVCVPKRVIVVDGDRPHDSGHCVPRFSTTFVRTVSYGVSGV